MNVNKSIRVNIKEKNAFFTSDLHLGHANIIKYVNRPFNNVVEMDSAIIDNWNKVVSPNDDVFIGGDVCLKGMELWVSYMKYLNGNKYLAIGNHDKNIPLDSFVKVDNRLNIVIYGDDEIEDGQRIIVDHYPLIVWDQSHRGSWQLFGHVHGGLQNSPSLSPNQMDIGMDVHNFTPISYEKVKEIITLQNLRKK